MVSETSWFGSFWRNSWKVPQETEKEKEKEKEKEVIGVMAFEVTNLMSKVLHLWQCLSDKQVVRIREEILDSEGLRKLVLGDDEFLVGLVCGEMIDNLGYVAKAVGRLGKKCTEESSLQRFEQVFDDLVQNDVDVYGWEYASKKMERKVKKMGRLIGVTLSFYHELEVLAELEQILRRMRVSRDPNLGIIQQKVGLRRQEVKSLREISLWGRTYDYTVRLLARSVFTIFVRIKYVFQFNKTSDELGFDDSISFDADHLPRSLSFTALMQSSVHPSENNNPVCLMSGPLRRLNMTTAPVCASGTETPIAKSASFRNKTRNRQCEAEDQSFILRQKHRPHLKSKQLASIGSCKGRMVSGTDSPIMPSCLPVSSSSLRLSGFSGIPSGAEERNINPLICGNSLNASLSLFCSKGKVLNAPPSTLGGAALALHYSNIIIFIEKLVASPHLMCPDARENLYNMLPASLRGSLRTKLKSYKKDLDSSVYDIDLGPIWGEVMKDILEWLAPLAHNMIKWQSERNFMQQHFVSQTNVLLVQTLYFADQAKTEAEMTELLVALNYVWRFEKKLNEKAFLHCSSSIMFDKYLYIKG